MSLYPENTTYDEIALSESGYLRPTPSRNTEDLFVNTDTGYLHPSSGYAGNLNTSTCGSNGGRSENTGTVNENLTRQHYENNDAIRENEHVYMELRQPYEYLSSDKTARSNMTSSSGSQVTSSRPVVPNERVGQPFATQMVS